MTALFIKTGGKEAAHESSARPDMRILSRLHSKIRSSSSTPPTSAQ